MSPIEQTIPASTSSSLSFAQKTVRPTSTPTGRVRVCALNLIHASKKLIDEITPLQNPAMQESVNDGFFRKPNAPTPGGMSVKAAVMAAVPTEEVS